MTDSEIAALLDRHSASEKVRFLLDCSVGRILRRDAQKGSVRKPTDEDLRHLTDWLAAAEMADAYWISRTDPAGRPLKLMKLGSIAACTAEADKAMHLESQRSATTTLGPEDEQMEFDCGDGFALVRLLTPAALDLESSRMGHCIGNGSYDGYLSRWDRCFLSLRSPNGLPHATLEISGEEKEKPRLVQAQGRSNRNPVVAHRRRIASFLVAYGIELPDTVLEGLIVGIDGTIRDASDPAAVIGDRTGSLSLSGDAAHKLRSGMRIEGSLKVADSDIEELPDGISLAGALTLEDCPSLVTGSASQLPGDGYLHIARCGIETFVCDGGSQRHLRMVGSRIGETNVLKLVRVPPTSRTHLVTITKADRVEIETDVVRKLEIEECGNISFGERLSADMGFSVTSTRVDAWPILNTPHFSASWTGITELPAFAKRPSLVTIQNEPEFRIVDRSMPKTRVSIHRSGLQQFDPEARSFGELSISTCPLASLPEGLRVKRDLVLSGVPLEKLPKGLKVGGKLSLNDMPIVELPSDMKVGGDVLVTGCPLDPGLSGRRTFWNLSLFSCGLTHLPADLRINGSLGLCGNPIRELPAGLRVTGGLDLRNTWITTLPADAKIGGLVLFGPVDPETPIVPAFNPYTTGSGFEPAFRSRSGGIRKWFGTRGGNDAFDGHPANSHRCRAIVMDSSGKAHNLMGGMPSDLRIRGDLELTDEVLHFGTGMEVSGSLRLVDCGWDTLPDGMRVRKDLSIRGRRNSHESMFRRNRIGDIDVYGNIELDGASLIDLPETLRVRGDLTVTDCHGLRLPRRLVVQGDAVLPSSEIERNKDGIETMDIHGDLVLHGPKIDLPSCIKVEGRVRYDWVLWSLDARAMVRGMSGMLRDRLMFRDEEVGSTVEPNFIEKLRPKASTAIPPSDTDTTIESRPT